MTKKYHLFAFTTFIFTSSLLGCSGEDNDYIGSICTTAAKLCPKNTILADGSILSINENQALYALLGNVYGGDSKTTFAVPDLRGRAPVSIDYTTITLGGKRGAETAKITSEQMPSHTHAATFVKGSGIHVLIAVSLNTTGNKNQPSITNGYLSASSDGNKGADMWSDSLGSSPVELSGVKISDGNIDKGSVNVGNTGESKSISITPPQLGINYCIVAKGVYPARPY